MNKDLAYGSHASLRSKVSGWGLYPEISASITRPRTLTELRTQIRNFGGHRISLRGQGRSYGDSSLASHMVETQSLDHILNFDPNTGELQVEGGVTFQELLRVFVPKGWFLPVVPGTQFISVGGAVACDIHGKNHHVAGTFCQHVSSLRLLSVDGREVLNCSPQVNSELFYATCGGMGLTGAILDVTLRLIKIPSSFIRCTTIKARNLREVISLFSEHRQATYSVAWMDCLKGGASLGRSLLMLGEHHEGWSSVLQTGVGSTLRVPCAMPGWLLNPYSIRAFNALYYHKQFVREKVSITHYEPFFFPLDRLHSWNRLYGKKGFLQYQFVLPQNSSEEGLVQILQRISKSQMGSFLAVLKSFGPANRNLLSFPMEGLTLALDFKIHDGVWKLLSELDRILVDHGGRIYLAKDARMSEETFKAGYTNWPEFVKIRQLYKADQVYQSLQSRRLGI